VLKTGCVFTAGQLATQYLQC